MSQEQRTVAIIQARLGSTRLPGKVLRDIAGKTMIQRVVERVQQANTLDEIVIATTNEPADQELVDFCESQSWNVFTGSEYDVLDRYVKTAKEYSADRIVRITSDCPLIEPTIIDQVVNSLGHHDYACNFHPLRRFPQGLDCEILTRSTLEKIDQLANQQRKVAHDRLLRTRRMRQCRPATNLFKLCLPLARLTQLRTGADAAPHLHFMYDYRRWAGQLYAYKLRRIPVRPSLC